MRWRRVRIQRRDQRGQAGGVEALAFGALVFISGTLIVANAWAVVDAKFAVDAAARDGAQTFVESGSDAAGAEAPARQVAASVLTNLGRRGDVDIALDDGAYRRCGVVTARVRTSVPVLRMPFVRASGGHIEVAGNASRRIDPYRSGIGGTAQC